MLWAPASDSHETFVFDNLGWELLLNKQGASINFLAPHHACSSAVHNGGIRLAKHFANLRITPDCPLENGVAGLRSHFERFCSNRGMDVDMTIGMMTAASMKSVRIKVTECDGAEIVAVVSTGLANARSAGDVADYRSLTANLDKVGTINILVGTSVVMTDSALVEAHGTIAEAKAKTLHGLKIKSKISDELATGTGTDATAVVSKQIEASQNQNDPRIVEFCGKHTIFGEKLANSVIEALTSSFDYKKENLA